MGVVRALVFGALAAVVAAGCGILPDPSEPNHSVVIRGPDGLRTFTVIREVDGTPVLCTLGGAIPPVEGVLRGDQGDPVEPVWLERADGRRLSIIWPEGFTVRFEPLAVLRDEGGRIVARDGSSVELPQVPTTIAAGTFEDPYIASGLVFDGCYTFLP
jgi:hypothetical protein